ncbi:MAG: 30S ribosome-binding factor RbfA [Hyphomicrobiales bacterium]
MALFFLDKIMGRSGHKSISKEPTQRMLRVGEVVRRAVDECLRRGEVREPELERIMVTVPEARMSSDLKLASVYVAPLGGGDGEELAKLLNGHAKFIRGRVAKDMTLKYMPEIKFFADNRYDEASRIENLLRQPKVLADLAAPDEAPEADDDSGA